MNPPSFKPKMVDYLGAHLPLSMFAFADDMDTLANRMIVMLLEKEGEIDGKFSKPCTTAISLLHKFFTSSFEFKPTLSSVLDAYDKRISDHTDEQKKILEFTSTQNQALIFGGAGTGKTFLAHEKARDFSNQGLNTLLLYFNSPITRESRRNLRGIANLTVKSFHEFCYDAVELAGITTAYDNNKELFDRLCKNA